MTLALMGIGVATVIELIMWHKAIWGARKFLSIISMAGLMTGSVALLTTHYSIWTLLLVITSLYRLINMLRILKGRTLADYLFSVARGTTLWLVIAQGIILLAAQLTHTYVVNAYTWLYALAALSLGFSLLLLSSIMRNLRTTRPPQLTGGYADKDLPSLTVAIPARNETADLSACLESLVTSNYPKLEILVLDDCSQNKRTPEIIRSFAHGGVRFIAGQNPPANWLAKNFAYEQLLNQSSGEIILFCGVDTRFEENSLKVVVQTMLQKKKTMFSIIPRNNPPGMSLLASLVQPSRYAWELGLPRRWMGRPAVLSTCWAVSRKLLLENGSFKAVMRSISPESYFAGRAAAKDDGYSFIQSDEAFALSSAKQFPEQLSTAIRTRYPQLHRRPEVACVLSLIVLTFIVTPYALTLAALALQEWGLAIASGLSVVSLSIFYSLVVTLTYRRFLLRGLWLLPFAGLYDIALLNYSMWKYEFSEVIWKGRNVCIPVMHAIASLPKLPEA
jgi:glycosyltransferase involved in cell wall biosynthesis